MHDWMDKHNLIANHILDRLGYDKAINVFWWLRRSFKKAASSIILIMDYCNRCGGRLQDYHAPDSLWNIAKAQARLEHIHDGELNKNEDSAGSYCYNCFVELLLKEGIVYCPNLPDIVE